jgi:hypothetical protein
MTDLDILNKLVKELNPNARITKADARIGKKYAVTIGMFDNLTDYMPLDCLKQFLLGVFNAELFNKRIIKH